MKAFTQHTGVAAALLRVNIDTDAIIPSREMKTVTKRGLAPGLFAGWRYQKPGSRELNPDFILNQPAYANTSIILAGANFGCGSSREHAVWALAEYGIRAIIAPSFGVIFYNNCIRNGILPIVLDEATIQELANTCASDPEQQQITIDLTRKQLSTPDSETINFNIENGHREMLLNGLDAIGMTELQMLLIDEFIALDRDKRNWAYSQS